MAEERVIDWLAIEGEYRAGIRSLRNIAAQFDVSEGAIRKRAKKEDWVRDLTEKIKQKADALVRNAAVRDSVRKDYALRTEKDIIDNNAEIQANIIISHRKDISKATDILHDLFDHIKMQTGQVESFEEILDILQSTGEVSDGVLTSMRKATALSSQADTFKKLMDSMKVKIGLEREAYGISDNSNGDANTEPLERIQLVALK